ncbi:cAMP-activated global transcriptional regulator CRP [Coralloluteibacterium stylophorae]|uniref:CRP-like protein Clp n=2 Tax=Coralloluteibacterium stylophorae TaxID=1776034 RepID=A0AAP2CBJ7_9GAMM|nr:cAMP-activated global transcriptional regulator CRP [Coralloluteibacterium stylophorae]MBS7457853.1 cAMP-activated global transcriptional regulator CRP [Coralloluteibacterium stylophorae]
MSIIALPQPARFGTQAGLAPDAATIERLLSQCHRRRYPNRTEVFRPGDPAGTLYYVIQGSLSIISEEPDGRELVLSYVNTGDFVGEMGLFVEAEQREVLLRTRSPCELAEIDCDRLLRLFTGPLAADAPKLLYSIGSQISKRLLDTSRKASRLAFLDVSGRIMRTLLDLCQEPDAMSHPQGTQIRVSRQELARIVGCSREMAGRVLKQLQADDKLHAHGKTVVVYGTR